MSASWLRSRSLTKAEIRALVDDRVLLRVGGQGYRRAGINGPASLVDWRCALLSARHLLGWEVHVESASALVLHGLATADRISRPDSIGICTTDAEARHWLAALPVDVVLRIRSRPVIVERSVGIVDIAIDPHDLTGLAGTTWDIASIPPLLSVASPERALLEMLSVVPRQVSFQQADDIFAGLDAFAPAGLPGLLQACVSFKAKRLLRFFCDRHRLRWLTEGEWEAVDMGRGVRRIVSGYPVNNIYGLTIPRSFLRPPQERRPDEGGAATVPFGA